VALPQTARAPGNPPSAKRAALFPELGMRRVRWVTIYATDDGVRAEVTGLAHRLPLVRPVSIPVANRLIRAGCPYVVRRDSRGRHLHAATPAPPSAS
jgi:hypothetical protein